jgi:hypothetical protein
MPVYTCTAIGCFLLLLGVSACIGVIARRPARPRTATTSQPAAGNLTLLRKTVAERATC